MIILPSLEIVPAKYNGSTLLSQIPIDGTGDFTVTRATSPITNRSTRVNALGLIETVLDNVPRLDYPLGGAVNGCPSLLAEPSAQNLALQSEAFNTTWSAVGLLAFGTGSVLNTTATLDPYGTNFADLIVANTTSQQHRVDQTTTSVSGSYTFSVFLKMAGYGFGRLRIGLAGATFDLVSGTISSSDVGIIASIQSYGNGWYRCIISKAASSANEIVRINMLPTATFADFEGDGTSGIYVFGAQYETGSAATSYIPTAASPVTRGAEVVDRTGISSLMGQTEGTFYLDMSYFAKGGSGATLWLYIVGTPTSNNIGLGVLGTSVRSIVNGQSDLLSTPSTANGVKIAWGYNGSGVVCFVNGVQYNLPTGGNQIITSMNRCVIDMSSAGGTRMADVRIRAAALYTTRLTNTQLALLTSPYTSYSSMASALSYTLG